MPPLIRIILPTRNSARTLKRCLHSIREQAYPRERIEIIIADAGSTDDTREITQTFAVDQWVDNPLRTAEAGKARALRVARGDLIAFIDSDNILTGSDWLRQMAEPFAEDAEIVLSEPLYFHHDPAASPINRYCALMGLNDPLCYYTGAFDRWNTALGCWTRRPLDTEDRGDWIRIRADADTALPTLGANGVFYRRAALEELPPDDYFFDVDIPVQLLRRSPRHFAKVKTSIEHDYCPSFPVFLRKQHRRVRDYWRHRSRRVSARQYPRSGIAYFILAVLLIVPALWVSIKGWRRKPDSAWFLHWPLCAATLAVYGWTTLCHVIAPKNR